MGFQTLKLNKTMTRIRIFFHPDLLRVLLYQSQVGSDVSETDLLKKKNKVRGPHVA
jgi:hypothetical protein